MRTTHSPRLVRGLDYYCHTAFEFVALEPGSDTRAIEVGAILAGGRYDGLCTQLGSGVQVPVSGKASSTPPAPVSRP